MKPLTMLLNKLLSTHLKSEKIIDPLQFGFQKEISINQAINTVIACIEDSINKKKEIHIIYLDFAKAFDCVDQKLLAKTLKHYKVHQKIRKIIKNLYSHCQVELHTQLGKAIKKIQPKISVKQGCILSPTLYNTFINTLLTEIRKSKLGYNLEKETIPFVAF